MTIFLRKFAFSAALLCLAVTLSAPPAGAQALKNARQPIIGANGQQQPNIQLPIMGAIPQQPVIGTNPQQTNPQQPNLQQPNPQQPNPQQPPGAANEQKAPIANAPQPSGASQQQPNEQKASANKDQTPLGAGEKKVKKQTVHHKKKRRKRKPPLVTLHTPDEVVGFQRRHGLQVDGVVGSETNRELKKTNNSVGELRAIAKRNARLNGDIDRDDVPPMRNGFKIVSSRFAKVEVDEVGSGMSKRYAINLNGRPFLATDSQSSIIGISKTYDMGNQEAIVLTAYNPFNSAYCTYDNRVLVLNSSEIKLLRIDNCTRAYEANVVDGSLYIEFLDREGDRTDPATWRLEGTTLRRL
jgi:hypothetical protein